MPGSILYPGDRTMSKAGNISAPMEHVVLWEFMGRGETDKYGSKQSNASKDNKCYGKKIKQPSGRGEIRMEGSYFKQVVGEAVSEKGNRRTQGRMDSTWRE